MVAAFVAGVAVALGLVAYVGYKFHSASAALAAVKVEVAKIEGELVAKEPALVAEAKAVVARIKALL